MARRILEDKHLALTDSVDGLVLGDALLEPTRIYVKDVRPKNYGTMLVWNKHAEMITGIPGKAVVGRKDKDILSDEVYAEIQARDRDMFARPEVFEKWDDPFRRPEGGVIYLHTISVPLLGPDGTPEFVLRISEDMTTRRRQQKDLQARTAEQVSEFIVSVFEFANPEKNPQKREITAREVLDEGSQRIGKELQSEPAVRA